MGSIHRLTAIQVTRATVPGMYPDGGGLYLQVSRFGTKSWIYRYQLDQRSREMGLGPAHSVTLAEAREKAAAARRLKVNGLDPVDQRREQKAQAKAEAARKVTFKTAAERYIASHRAAWKNAKHAHQWAATLQTYVYPLLGDQAVAEIDTGLVLQVLDAQVPLKGGGKATERFWTSRPETASRVRGRIEAILDWARVRGYRTGENPARWRGHLDKLLPAQSKVRKVKHHPALPFAELPVFMPELRGREGVAPRALEFAILTAARTGEVLGARWDEIDLQTKIWTIPADRMKAGREHRVPLCKRAIELLGEGETRTVGGFIFPGAIKDQPLSNMALLETLRRMERGDLTAHGFRSTFRDWAAERTSYPGDVVEMALAHAVKDKVEAAYRRGDLFEKRRRLMEEWGKFCLRPPLARPAGDNVVAAFPQVVNG